MTRVIVEVMPKPEILDPQGKAVTGALERLGFSGLQVRQGKRFEIEVDGPADAALVARVREAAETLLCNTVIENFEVRVADEAKATDQPSQAEPTAPTPAGVKPAPAATPAPKADL